MQNTNPGNDTQPQHVSDAAETSSTTAGASSQPPEQAIEGTDKATAESAETAPAPTYDEVLEASLESFPASDPPAWASGSA
ncbi:MAG TPA: hypothetical protein VFU32_05775 [Ktedonobacterales bacterium]|nr:hypothetical protein [Ktedonobacterales bacterium]